MVSSVLNVEKPTALIIGAGPAGLTAAYELLARTDIQPTVIEMSEYMGGIARTVNYKGNLIDIGGHRFFSRSDRVMQWWLKFLPLQKLDDSSIQITYRRQHRMIESSNLAPDPGQEDRVMLLRSRLSRVLFAGHLFSYPITLSLDTVRKLGILTTFLIGLDYLRSTAFPIHPEESLEDFFINRFGRRLYRMFFKTYTEKIWGVPSNQISAEWGAQRIKGLSLYKAFLNILSNALPARHSGDSGKDKETSLIECFLYPKFGPGQMWDEVARSVIARGGQVLTGLRVDRIEHREHGMITAIWTTNPQTGDSRRFTADYFFSTMPVRELTDALEPAAPTNVREVAHGLIYRNFIMVGILCRSLSIRERLEGRRIKDNWIYIQEPEVLAGRLQIFNNWSPYLVSDSGTVWIGLEYFCNETDSLWRKSDAELSQLAKDELRQVKFVAPEDVLDSVVIRMPKAYPAYFGAYYRFREIRAYADAFENLFLIGRNGMHHYNNQDHSVLTAMTAVDNIVNGVRSRENLWALNTEMEYHESK